MHAGKKQSRRMKGGMTTGQWGTAVFGDSSSQRAAGVGSNVIHRNDPNARPMNGGGVFDDVKAMISGPATEEKPPGQSELDETSPSMLDSVTGLFNSEPESAAAAAKKAEEEAAAASAAAPVTGGKGKRKSATKRRKSHKKKGKSSKKRAHKRH